VGGWGLAEAASDDLFLRLGLDPTGGLDPAADSVVWSPCILPQNLPNSSVSATPAGS
jgi:hypothetical protein